jgi:uncharacterized protein (DUF305 family)
MVSLSIFYRWMAIALIALALINMPERNAVCGMIAHHMGAISMSEAELKYGDNKWAKQTARKISDAQKKEIEEMSQWLDEEAK